MSWPCRGPMPDRIVACGWPCRRPGKPCRRPGRPCHRPGRSCCSPAPASRALHALIVAPDYIVTRHKVAPLSATIQLLYRDPAPSLPHCAPCRARPQSYRRPCRSTLLPCYSIVSQPWLHCIATPTLPLRHDTKLCIATLTPSGQALTCAPLALACATLALRVCRSPLRVRRSPLRVRRSPLRVRRSPLRVRRSPLRVRRSPLRVRRSPLHAGRPYHRASQPCHRSSPQPYRGPVQPCPGCIVGAAATPCLLCRDTMHCIVTKAGKWAVAHPASRKMFFFFTHFFFHSSY